VVVGETAAIGDDVVANNADEDVVVIVVIDPIVVVNASVVDVIVDVEDVTISNVIGGTGKEHVDRWLKQLHELEHDESVCTNDIDIN
jgi:hypothetical protein